jgi:hypothetical protein
MAKRMLNCEQCRKKMWQGIQIPRNHLAFSLLEVKSAEIKCRFCQVRSSAAGITGELPVNIGVVRLV